MTALSMASQEGHSDVVKLLLGAESQQVNRDNINIEQGEEEVE